MLGLSVGVDTVMGRGRALAAASMVAALTFVPVSPQALADAPAQDAAPAAAAREGEPSGRAPGSVAEGISPSAGRNTDVGEKPEGGQDAAALPDPAEPLTEAEAKAQEVAELCRLLTSAAGKYGVPEDFFIRLIWKESRFNPRAVSPVGAQGIAQFMPGTARIRGLKDPFDREEALLASASFLADLEARFGSWGLAAAGYNGGPNRVPRFVSGEAGLPYETIDYVYSITGRTAEYWALRARGDAPPRPAVPTGWRRLGNLAPLGRSQSPANSPVSGASSTLETPPAETAQAVVADLGSESGPTAAQELSANASSADSGSVARETASPIEVAATDPAHVLPPQADATAEAHAAQRRLLYPPPVRPEIGPRPVNCPQLVARLGTSRSITPPTGGGGWTVWGAQVAGHPKRAVAMRQYERLRAKLPSDLVAKGPRVVVRRFAARGRLPIHAVQFAAPDKAAAEAICKRISKSLAPCVVVKNG